MKDGREFTTSIANAEKTSGEINISQFDAAHFYINSSFTGNHVSYVAAEKPGGTFKTPKTAATGSADAAEVTTEVASHLDNWHTFPPHLFGMHSVKIISSTAQSAYREIIVCGVGPD